MWGSLGDIVFQIHKTPRRGSFIRKNKFDYAKIEILKKPKVQFLRENLEEVEFEIRFFAYAGIDVRGEIEKLKKEARNKKPLTFIVGDDVLGEYVIEQIEETYNATDSNGNLKDVSVKVKLLEYK